MVMFDACRIQANIDHASQYYRDKAICRVFDGQAALHKDDARGTGEQICACLYWCKIKAGGIVRLRA